MSRLWRAALLLLVLSQDYGQSNGELWTVVRVAGWTIAGERLENIWVVISSLDGKHKYMAHGRDVRLSVPTGEYLLQVEAPGFQAKRQMLQAYQPDVFRSAALPVVWSHGRVTSVLTGKVKNYAGHIQDLRVRLMGLYGDVLREAIPDTRASFSFPADAGTYLLVVVADLKKGIAIMDSQPVRIPFAQQQTVTVDLEGKAATPIPRPAP